MDDAEDLYLVIPMCNLLEYNSNYSDTTGSLWFYSKDEVASFNANIEDGNTLKSFKYKAILLENTEADEANGILKNTKIAMLLMYLSNSRRSLETPLINCKAKLKLKWTNHCVLFANGNDNDDANSNNLISTIKDTKLYIPVVTLSTKNNRKLSKHISKGFERSLYWNVHKTKSENKKTRNE